jgi:hypothetical protein
MELKVSVYYGCLQSSDVGELDWPQIRVRPLHTAGGPAAAGVAGQHHQLAKAGRTSGASYIRGKAIPDQPSV